MIISGVMPFETSKQKQEQQHRQAAKHQPIHRRGINPAGDGRQSNDPPDARGKGEEMSDLINRQAAIDAVKKNTFRLTFAEEQNCEGHVAWSANAVYSDVIEGALLELPSAQPERKRGKWIYGEDEYGIDGYHCDKCGFFVPWDYAHKFINYIEDYNLCPNCGADMREVDDE